MVGSAQTAEHAIVPDAFQTRHCKQVCRRLVCCSSVGYRNPLSNLWECPAHAVFAVKQCPFLKLKEAENLGMARVAAGVL